MNKIKNVIAIIACIGLVAACGGKSIPEENKDDSTSNTEVSSNDKEYDSYQSACRNQDFEAAYEWIEKHNGSEEDKDYVFNAEMLYLTSLGTEEASNRIVYLLAEFKMSGTPVNEGNHYGDQKEVAKNYIEGLLRHNRRCDNVLDMAIIQGNKALAKKIITMYQHDMTDYYIGLGHTWIKGFCWKSKKAAQKKFDDAVIEGVFNNK